MKNGGKNKSVEFIILVSIIYNVMYLCDTENWRNDAEKR